MLTIYLKQRKDQLRNLDWEYFKIKRHLCSDIHSKAAQRTIFRQMLQTLGNLSQVQGSSL